MKKILSIVIPTYNVEKYLDRCLISLLANDETNKDIELLVVNDGSKDNSLKIAQKYEKKYPNTVKVIDKENGGHGSTINVGLEKATGKYFRVIDSDDWVNVEGFPKYVEDLKNIDTDIIITNYRKEFIYNGTSMLFKYNKKIKYNHKYELDKFDFDLLKDDYFFMATTTFKTEKLRKANFKLDEKTFYVDMEFILFPIPDIKDFIYLDYDIYRYFIGRPDQSINLASYVRNRSHHDKVSRKLVKFYESGKLDENRKKYVGKILTLLLNTHYSIYCKMNVKENAKKDIKKFDTYLKKTSPELYARTNYGYIKYNRKTNFMFCQTYKNVFSKLADRFNKRGEQ